MVCTVSAVPLALHYPSSPVMPGLRDQLLLAGVCAGQFLGQIMINRGFQLASSVRCVHGVCVCVCVCCFHTGRMCVRPNERVVGIGALMLSYLWNPCALI
jgi:hypothetical protein